MIKPTEDQRDELSSAEPVAIDPQTRQVYVLVRKEVYDKLRGILEDLPETGAAARNRDEARRRRGRGLSLPGHAWEQSLPGRCCMRFNSERLKHQVDRSR
jgi:hypothetical protein